MFQGVTLSKANYDLLLTYWSQQSLQQNVTFSGGNSKYSYGTPATSRLYMVKNKNWIITDGGIDRTTLPPPMILEIKTNSSNQSATLPLTKATIVDIIIDWGDGISNVEYNTPSDISHQYTTAGTYTVTIDKTLSQFGNGSTTYSNADKITKVKSFGGIKLTSLAGAFQNAYNLIQISALPTTTTITDLSYAFAGATGFNDSYITTWITSGVTNLDSTFKNATAFNQDISTWNTSNVTNMKSMFEGATTFNKPVTTYWNTSNVTTMQSMFNGAVAFDQAITGWNIKTVSNMTDMFANAGISKANYDLTLLNWASQSPLQNSVIFNSGTAKYSYGSVSDARLSIITNYGWTFIDNIDYTTLPAPMLLEINTNSINQSVTLPLNGKVDVIIDWGDGITNQQYTSSGNISHQYLIAGTYTVKIDKTLSQFGNGSSTYSNADKITKVKSFGGIRLTSLAGAFQNAYNLTQITALPTTSTITDLSYTFAGATGFNDSYIKNWTTSGITNLNSTFTNASSFNQDLSGWNITNVKSMTGLLNNTNVSSSNYTYTLIGWAKQIVQTNVILGASNIKYYTEGVTARNILTSTPNNWIINDNGQDGFLQSALTLTYSNITSSTVIQLPIQLPTAYVFIDWGDNTTTTTNIAKPSHTYTSTYSNVSIKIRDDVPGITSFAYFGLINPGVEVIQGITKLSSVVSFGALGLTSLRGAFYNASTLISVPSTFPSTVTDLSYTFYGATLFDNGLTGWNVTNITNAENMFVNSGITKSSYNNLLSSWGYQNVQSNVSLGIGTSVKYSYFVPTDGHYNLAILKNWTILDGDFDITTSPTPLTLLYGVTGSNMTVTLPLNGKVDVLVNWGDGLTQYYFSTISNQSYTYATPGNYTVQLRKTLSQFGHGITAYPNADRLLKVTNFGEIRLTSLAGAFQNAVNLTQITALPSVNSKVTNISYMFKGATSFNDPYIIYWGTLGITTFESTFENATSFNQDISSWSSKTANVTNMNSTFKGAISFNQSINTWHMTNVSTMISMFDGATAFNQDLSDWNITSAQYMANMFNGVTLSTQNYNLLLSSWARQAVKSNVIFNGGNSMYTYGTESDKRLSLITNYNWTITDGGTDPASLPNPMLLKYKTTGINQSITLPLYGKVDVVINWGDSSPLQIVYSSGDITHTYSSAGEYIVQIDKTLTKFGKGITATANIDKLIDVINFGNLRTTDFSGAFNGAINLVGCTGIPPASIISDLSYTFKNCISLNDPLLANNSYTNTITNLTSTFENASTLDQSFANWNVVNVTSFLDIFKNDTLSNTNYSDTLISWVAQNVKSNISFNGGNSYYLYGDASDAVWTLKKFKNWTFIDNGVTNLPEPMILEAQTNQINQNVTLPLFDHVDVIIDWDDGSPLEYTIDEGELVHMYDNPGIYQIKINNTLFHFGSGENDYGNSERFRSVISFGGIRLNSLSGAFRNAYNLVQITALPSTVTDLSYMFLEALVINDPYIQTWNTSNVTNMVSMFSGANSFDQPIGSWNVKNVTNMTDMFLDGKLSKTNYDHLLNGWGSLTGLQSRVVFNAGSSIYSYKAAGAKNNLVNTYKWTIIDGGIEKNNPPVVYNFSYASISNGSVQYHYKVQMLIMIRLHILLSDILILGQLIL